MEQKKKSMTIKEIKKLSRQQLEANSKIAYLVVFVYFFIFFILSFIPIIGSIALFVFGGALLLGITTFFLRLAREEKLEIDYLFSGFKKLGSSFLLYFLEGLFIFLWSLITIIPSLILYFLMFGTGESIYNYEDNYIIKVFGLFVVFIILLIPAIIAAYRYSMAYYVLSDCPDIGAYGAIVESKKIMKGNKLKLFYLQISFIGWGILSYIPVLIVLLICSKVFGIHDSNNFIFKFVLGLTRIISSMFVLSYMQTAMANFYIDLKSGHEE
ncbi:DUF975 family protein [Clostridium felsineum]|uniref:Uncharacterized protein n=1 Tax=Clostridium felsineum TaxID=36839 RepID=A0A1S8MBY4_9CLOT|nr:DUF975 family protein [Clostridium felsineum]MCR3759475.1 DUF975 family protein [Clostridium felsineum]URZ04158.1 hypothetical protein CLAUR_042460 [Clostridium felsineum]URZ07652.1 hypothetical protein CLROS_029910 [Clostridium felsineum]URZ12683.1 hypothetical protein CROST_034060 [Clostridium felsineum]URZ17326.1 hypothetical protein CLFE_033790 [Clostridium felsineum DSM 794]